MAPGSNWLSFALPPMEAMRPSCQSQMLPAKFMPYEISADSSHQYYFQNFDDNGAGLSNMRAQIPYMEESKEAKELKTSNISDLSFLTSPNPQIQQIVPKLEDFLGGHSTSLGRYSDTQTETQESSLSSVYEQSSSHFSDQQDLNKAIAVTTAFQAFSTTSGSEVDDSFSATGTRLTCSGFGGYSIESGNELVFSDGPRALSLAVTPCSEKAIVSVESESSKKMIDTFGQRTSIFRGVTRHRWTGRYEAHLWDNSCRREGQTRKGRQVYLGGYDKEEKAARAYDLAALKYWGPSATTNFSVSNYTKEIEEMKNMTKQEFIASLRRKSSGFSRGASIYRGVTRHHQQGRWQARIGRVAGNKDLYLGTFGTEEEAAEAYDIAAIKFRGVNAVTNFEMNRYDVEAIASSALPIGGAAKRLKLSLEGEPEPLLLHDRQSQSSSSISFDGTCVSAHVPLDTTSSLYQNNFLQHLQSTTSGTPAYSTTTATATATSAIVTPTVLYPHPDYYGRSLFYGLTTPINMVGGYSNNNNYSTPNVNPQPWNAGSSSN